MSKTQTHGLQVNLIKLWANCWDLDIEIREMHPYRFQAALGHERASFWFSSVLKVLLLEL